MLDEIDRTLEGLPLANIAYNAPRSLSLGDRTVIELRLSARQPLRDLKRRVSAVGGKVGARIRVADRMEAHLSGLGFQIETITPERQAVSGAGETQWKWEIEPTETGPLRLHLTLTALIDVRGSQSLHTIRTFDSTLKVRVAWPERVSGFLESNWQWLWTAVLIPAGAWVLRARRKSATLTEP